MKVSITIPWVREKGFDTCLRAIEKNAGIDASEYEIVAELDKERIGLPRMLKKLVSLSRAEEVMFLADDSIPQPGFLENALKVMERLPDGWGLVGLNDGFQDGNKFATHFLGHKRLLPFLDGEFFSTAYHHCCVDWELTMRCKELGRYLWAEDARIIHNHPGIHSFRAMMKDADYRRAYAPRNYVMDHLTYLKRRLNNWR